MTHWSVIMCIAYPFLICAAFPITLIDTNIKDVLQILVVGFPAITVPNDDYMPTINGRTRYSSKSMKRKRREDFWMLHNPLHPYQPICKAKVTII